VNGPKARRIAGGFERAIEEGLVEKRDSGLHRSKAATAPYVLARTARSRNGEPESFRRGWTGSRIMTRSRLGPKAEPPGRKKWLRRRSFRTRAERSCDRPLPDPRRKPSRYAGSR
jgi:hypothetical protein